MRSHTQSRDTPGLMQPPSTISARKSWYGWKLRVKRILMSWPLNSLLVTVSRRYLSPSRAQRLPVAQREVAGSICGSYFTMLDPGRCTIAKELFWGNGTRPDPEQHYALAFVTNLASRADIFLDVGSSSGVFTLAASRRNPALQVHAFEIVPEVYALLFDNCVRNDVLHRVTCHHVGLGEGGASVVLPVRTGGSSLPTSLSSRRNFATGVRVGIRTLDSLLPDFPVGARMVIKVDVEGTENEVFQHGQRVIGQYHPDILCEVLASQSVPGVLEELLAFHGYSYYLVTEQGLQPRQHIEPVRGLRDWFFTTSTLDVVELDIRAVGGIMEEGIQDS